MSTENNKCKCKDMGGFCTCESNYIEEELRVHYPRPKIYPEYLKNEKNETGNVTYWLIIFSGIVLLASVIYIYKINSIIIFWK